MAKAILEAARGHMAAMVEQDTALASDVITFTSGGTEVRLMLLFSAKNRTLDVTVTEPLYTAFVGELHL